MSETRKAINFDLDQKALTQYYEQITGKKLRMAWYDIEVFLKKNGFEHRQYSGYVSKNPMSKVEVEGIIIEATRIMQWLPLCIKVCDVTSIQDTYDLKKVMLEYADLTHEVFQPDITNNDLGKEIESMQINISKKR